ncbi:MAG: folylpolyglutamate synthase/dihydrofolate synthase family protein [Myxococcota bacterium]
MDGPGRAPTGTDPDYRAVIERLHALARSGTKFGLERIERVFSALGNPERGGRTVHIAGSNGKGSTAAFLARILAESGARVGLFTSPHLVSLRERIRFLHQGVDELIPPAELVEAVRRVEQVSNGLEDVSFFEAVTAAALVAMRARAVDVAVVEAGLGARLDATRLVEAEVAVLTDLSLEHTAILGDTIEEIAAEEGAVLRPGRPLVMASGPAGAMKVVDGMAREHSSPVLRLGRDFHVSGTWQQAEFRWDDEPRLGPLRLALVGPHQLRNAALAATSARLLGAGAPALERGLLGARWPGRMESRYLSGTRILLDGAQNPHAAGALAAALAEDRSFDRGAHVVFGVLADKDASAMIRSITPFSKSWLLTRPTSERARDPHELLPWAPDAQVEALPGRALERALRASDLDGRPVLVCGSLYLVGDVVAALDAASFAPLQGEV